MKRIFPIIFCLCLPLFIWGQTRKPISGRVTDKQQTPLAHVSVSVPGSSAGTITDKDGTFRLDVPDNATTLNFSFVGLKPQNIALTAQTFYQVEMQEETLQIDEVVVNVGYGYVRKSDLTGAVSSISSKATEGRIVNNIEDALKGRVAGVQITSFDGEPGAGVDIKIRGTSSISASNTPLYVIDGIPYDMNDDFAGEFDYFQFGTTSSNPMDGLSPGDIESIEILKDASATAIYGSRGVNGVILITTKKGRVSKAQVEYAGNVGFSRINRRIEVMNGAEYAKFMFDMKGGYAAKDNPWSNYADYALPGAVNTDWQSELFRLGLTNDHRISVSGGTKEIQYALMGNLFDQQGTVIGSGYKRYSGRLNLSAQLARNLTFSTNLSASHSYKDGIANGVQYGPLAKALQASPLKTVDDLNSESEEGDAVFNPLMDARTSVKDRTEDSYQIAATLTYKFLKDFTLEAKGAYLDKKTLNEGFISPLNPRSKDHGTATISQYSSAKLLGQATLTYYKRFNKQHRLSVMAGATIERYINKGHSIVTGNFDRENLGVDNIGLGNMVKTPSSLKTRTALASFLGRVNYNYSERYLLTATFRADGSSKFPTGNKFAYFPSVALAWRANEERFLKNAAWLNDLKVRASFGIVGNQAIPAYESLQILQNSKISLDGKGSSVALYPLRLENRNLRWESTYQYNAGLDLAVLNNRIALTFDAYYKETRDMLLQMNTPKYSGFASYWTNAGSVVNKGIEVTLNTLNVDAKGFKWSTNFNIAFNRSKVLSLGLDNKIDVSGDNVNAQGTIGVIRVGEPFGQFYGYIVDGLWQSVEQIEASGIKTQLGTAAANLKPGYKRYRDLNGDGVIDDSDKSVIGHGEPRFTGGFNNYFEYKNFDLTINTEFSVGGDLFNAKRIMLENTSSGSNQSSRVADRFRPSFGAPGDEIYDPGQPSNTIKRADSDISLVPTNEYIEDGSYLRISDIILGYTFRPFRHKKTSVKVYLSAKNLHVFSDYLGYDPEVNTGQAGFRSLMPGVDSDAYPKATTYTIGLNLRF